VRLGSVRLFDGQTLDGWECPDEVFRVEDGVIVGGFRDQPLKHSHYLCTRERYGDFDLSLEVKIDSEDILRNGGVSFRAERVRGSTEVAGYQADIGYAESRVLALFSDQEPEDLDRPYPLWGVLVDEFRSNTSRYTSKSPYPVIFLQVPDESRIEHLIHPDDWNAVRVVARGPEIDIHLNGERVVQYVEQDDWVPREGVIALQAHSGEPYEIRYRNIRIRRL
jgi:hypothetical protein